MSPDPSAFSPRLAIPGPVASPSLAARLAGELDLFPGQRLLAVGTATLPYLAAWADQGIAVLPVASLTGGGWGGVAASPVQLPFQDGAADACLSVHALQDADPWEVALEEIRRVVERGTVVLALPTEETVLGNWISYYFPERARTAFGHYPGQQELAQAMRLLGYARPRVRSFTYQDGNDGTLAALKHWPVRLLDPQVRSRIPFFGRMDPGELEEGLEQLEQDFLGGSLWHLMEYYRPYARRYGDLAIVTATLD